MSEECNKNVKLADKEPNDFIAFSCFMAPESVKISQAGMIL
jgi:hypothetical protein